MRQEYTRIPSTMNVKGPPSGSRLAVSPGEARISAPRSEETVASLRGAQMACGGMQVVRPFKLHIFPSCEAQPYKQSHICFSNICQAVQAG
jgi:hypothetical protein